MNETRENSADRFSTRELLTAFGVRPNKKRGQNFLTDPAMARAIVRAAGVGREDTVLEIGAGLGALTVPLAASAGRVFSLEWDKRLFDILCQRLEGEGLENVVPLQGDILRTDLNEIAEQAGGRLLVVGNLPYHISSQILAKLAAHADILTRAVLMFQLEMARRILAPEGSRDYGRISVLARQAGRVRTLLPVPATVFFPRPKVESLVISLDFTAPPGPRAKDPEVFAGVLRAAFGKRRKTLKNALSNSLLDLSPDRAEAVLLASGIEPVRRAETLSVEEFVRLSDRVAGELASGA